MREGFNPFYIEAPQPHQGRPRIQFSRTELNHLMGAVALLTLCFAIVRGYNDPSYTWFRLNLGFAFIGFDLYVLIGSLLAVATGFVLHELAHKVVAQHYGHWAEFRAQFSNLLMSLAMSVALGLFFAAPGAVMIQGAVTRRENGLISLVGPGVNFAIAAAVWPLSWSTNPFDPLPTILSTIAYVNAGLCVFNLIPLGPLDGRKVWAWNKGIYFVSLLAAVVLLVAIVWQVLQLGA